MMTYILLEPLRQYQEQHPEVRFDLVGDDVNLDLVRHDADIVVRMAMDHAPGITQVPIYTLVKRLYASQSYIDRYGEPKTVEDLRDHKIISRTDKRNRPYSDILWALRLASVPGHLRTPDYEANTTECLVRYLKNGHGIMGCYSLMSYVREENLINVVPSLFSDQLHVNLCTAKSMECDESVTRLIWYLREVFKPYS